MEGYKTYVLSFLAVMAAMVLMATNSVTTEAGVAIIVNAVLASTLRHGVSTEALRIKRRYIPMAMLGALLLTTLALPGCNGLSHVTLTPDGEIDTANTGASVASMDNEGLQTAAFQGTAPSLLKQDEQGNWSTMPGPVGVLSFNPKTEQVYLVSPKDAEVAEFTIERPDGTKVSITGIKTNLSNVVDIYARQYADAMVAVATMSEQQARVHLEGWVQAGKLAPHLLEAVMKAAFPVP